MAIIKVITPSVTDANITTAKVTDNAITLAKMASGTDGNIISYDASGNPVAVATGSSGQVLTSAGAGAVPSFQALASGGKIAQVISTNNTTTGTFGSTTFGDMTGQTVNITPSASNSKILIFNHISVSVTNNNYVQFKLLRDSTSIGAGSDDGNRIGCITSIEGTGTDHMRTVAFQVLDSPSTTNQITYKAQLRTHDSNTVAFNRTVNDANQGYTPRASSEITVMEILA